MDLLDLSYNEIRDEGAELLIPCIAKVTKIILKHCRTSFQIRNKFEAELRSLNLSVSSWLSHLKYGENYCCFFYQFFSVFQKENVQFEKVSLFAFVDNCVIDLLSWLMYKVLGKTIV